MVFVNDMLPFCHILNTEKLQLVHIHIKMRKDLQSLQKSRLKAVLFLKV